MAAAVPFAIKAGAMIGGSLLGKKLGGASKDQQQAMTQTSQAGTNLGAVGGPLLNQGRAYSGEGANYLRNAGNYYNNILSNRFAARESMAPEMTTALDFYRGAENKAKRTLSGGSRDYATAELDRQKVGQLAGFLPQARRAAAEGAAGVGSEFLGAGEGLTGQGMNALSNAAYINSGLFNQATAIRNQQGEAGKTWGGLIYDIAKDLPWGKKPVLPSGRTTPQPPITPPIAIPNRPTASVPTSANNRMPYLPTVSSPRPGYYT